MANARAKLVLAIEGGDGTGKSTLAEHVAAVCRARGLSSAVIGRLEGNSDVAVGKFSDLLKWSGEQAGVSGLDARADGFVRVAREYQRVQLVNQCNADVVLLDRFVLSVASRARSTGGYDSHFEQALVNLASTAKLAATIFCDCPFDVAWARVQRRAASGIALSPKEKRGESYNRELSALLRASFEAGAATGEKWPIDTSAPIDSSRRQLTERITPKLESFFDGGA